MVVMRSNGQSVDDREEARTKLHGSAERRWCSYYSPPSWTQQPPGRGTCQAYQTFWMGMDWVRWTGDMQYVNAVCTGAVQCGCVALRFSLATAKLHQKTGVEGDTMAVGSPTKRERAAQRHLPFYTKHNV